MKTALGTKSRKVAPRLSPGTRRIPSSSPESTLPRLQSVVGSSPTLEKSVVLGVVELFALHFVVYHLTMIHAGAYALII